MHFRRFLTGVCLPALVFISMDYAQDGSAHSLPTSSDEAAVKLVAKEYLKAVSEKDVRGVSGLWKTDSPHLAGQIKQLEAVFSAADNIEIKTLNFINVSISESSSSVRIVAELSFTDLTTGKPRQVFDSRNRFIYLEQASERWRIVRDVSYESVLAEKLAVLRTDTERESLVGSNRDVISNTLIRAIVEKGRSVLIEDPFMAEEVLRVALDLANGLGEEAYAARSILPNLAIAYIGTGDYQRALELSTRTAEFFRRLNNEDFETRVYGNMAVAYAHLGDFHKSVELNNRRVEWAKKTNNQMEMITPLVNMSTYYRRLGDHYRRTVVLAEAIRIMEEIGTKNPEFPKTELAGALMGNMGNAYADLGDEQNALEYYQKSLAITADLGLVNTTSMNGLAKIHSLNGKHMAARGYYEKSLQYDRDRKYKKGIVVSLENIASTYAAEGAFEKALEWDLDAMNVREEIGDTNDGYKLGVADDYFRLGNLNASLEIAEPITRIVKREQNLPTLMTANLLVGRIHKAKGNGETSLKYFEESIAIAEQLNERITGFDFGQSTSPISPYHSMVDLLVGNRQYPEAFSIAERIKARGLISVLTDGKVDVFGAMSIDERATEKQLKQELISINAQLALATGRPRREEERISELRERLRQSQAKFQTFQLQVKNTHPELQVQRARMDPIGLEDSGAMLSVQTAVLAAVTTTEHLFFFLLTKNRAGKPELTAFDAPVKAKQLTAQVGSFRTTLASGGLDFQKDSRELYDLLLKPVEKELAGKANIIIVPDGPLWDLPFQALMDERGKYLVEKAAISYAPSLTALREMQKRASGRKAAPDAELIAFGNPIVGKETKERVQRVFMSEKLDPLPEAERLVNELGKMYGPKRSKVLIGNDAREEVAKSEVPKYRIVQFATHGILNNVSPMYSHLVMAQDAKNPNEDGLLEAWELKDLNLNADMVILSACDTARGKISGGEGIIGMTWASFIAGAPTTVASQWKVESSSTTEFMLEFHQQLLAKKRVSKAEAMRRAALKLMRTPKYRHPSYWGAWVLVGDGS